MRIGSRIGGSAFLTLGLALLMVQASASTGSSAAAATEARVNPDLATYDAASSIVLFSDGVGSNCVGLNWTSGPGFWYNDYYVYESTNGANGTWNEAAAPSSPSAFISDLRPSTTYWFFVWDKYLSGNVSSNVAEVTTQPAPEVTQVSDTDSSATIQWSNPTYYSEVVGFEQYSILEYDTLTTPNQWRYLANISDYSERQYTIAAFPYGSSMEVLVEIWNECLSGCSATEYVAVESGPIVAHTYTAPPPQPPSTPPTSSPSPQSSSNSSSDILLWIIVILVVVGVVGSVEYEHSRRRKNRGPPPTQGDAT